VLRELEWEPEDRSTEIGVAVKDGIATLVGAVDNYGKRYHAERTAAVLCLVVNPMDCDDNDRC
jgi:hypothetical protein